MVRLTAALISSLHDGKDIRTLPILSVPRRDLDQLVGLEVCESLTRLDLTDNRLSSIDGLSMCNRLKWLSIAGNQLTSLKGVECLLKLTVLNASRNELTSMSEVAILSELRALIINDNKISTVVRLDRLSNLNTLVLSRNPIRNLGKVAVKLVALSKLSASHCQLQILGSSLKHCVGLEELRLSHNQLTSLPKELERNGRLSILDLGTNYIRAWSDIQILETLHSLVNLNLRGNPICSNVNYLDEVKARLPNLQILDGHPLEDTHRKKKKKAQVKGGQKDEETGKSLEKAPDTPQNGEHCVQVPTVKPKKRKSEKPDSDIESNEEQPFLDLILASPVADSKPPFKSVRQGDLLPQRVTGLKKKFDDSGVVSIEDNKVQRNSDGRNKSIIHLILQSSSLVDVGMGGPSAWENEPAISKAVEKHVVTVVDQITKQIDSKPYSRWKLKKAKQ